jgi:hypothetical protein
MLKVLNRKVRKGFAKGAKKALNCTAVKNV